MSTKLITTIGTNFLENAEFHKPLADVLKKDGITLEQMKSDQLREVIEKPTQKLGIEVEKRLVERLIEDVIEKEERLALLAFSLIELWEKQNGKQLTYRAYEEITENEYIAEVYKREQKKRAEQKKRPEQNNLTKKTSKNNTISKTPIVYRIVILLFLFFVGMPVVLEFFPIIFDSPVRIICKLKDKC